MLSAEFRLLGPTEVWAADRTVDIGPPQRRAVLAALLVDAGQPVTLETLSGRVWDGEQPDGARRALHAHLARLRKALDGLDAELVRRSGGYLLEISPDRVDLHRFRRMAAAARDAGGAEQVRLLRDALDQWRGEPLADLTGGWVRRSRELWHRERLDAAVRWATVELRLHGPDQVIGRVRELLHEYPLAEPLSATLIRALAMAGRAAEALDWYAATRARLVEELGTEPGRELQELHRELLHGESSAPRTAVPLAAQLPMDVRGFAGRGEQLARLDDLLAGTAREPTAVVISAVSGTAGVGKTALAVHWAHRAADRFPDGQLYVNLRGFDPAGAIMSPAEAVRGFLDALGVPARRVPTGIDAQAALYRSLLAGRRMLVLLDNARDAAQVRPLLPGAQGCAVLVTSRNRLHGLVAAEGALPLTLDVLSTSDARELLAGRLGAERVAAEPGPVEEIVTRCARLPLALSIVAARAAGQPDTPLATLAAELRAAGGSLDAFRADEDDARTDVRAVFSWSYRTLSTDAARLFRLLGLHSGPDVSAPAVASLAGEPLARVRAYLDELTRAHLVAEHAPGRYSLHDLLLAYAGELARAEEPEADRRAAISRLLDHYLHTAHRGALLLYPRRHPIVLADPAPGVTPEELADHRLALAWFAAEHHVLLSMVELAAAGGFERRAWQLAWTLWDFLDRRGHWHDLVAVQHTALAAAERTGDLPGQAHGHHGLGFGYDLVGRSDDALRHLDRAAGFFGALGDHAGQANVELSICSGLAGADQLAEATRAAERALDLYRAAGHRFGQAGSLNNIGLLNTMIGNHEPALPYCEQALSLYEELDDRHGQATTWDSLGSIRHNLGDHAAAVDCYERSLAIFRDFGDRHEEANTLVNLGETQLAAGQPEAARRTWRLALDILDELGHPNASEVRARLKQIA
jgi:DNA-binding SARP family transcriptional activator/tetratricopeptide (TPR) repeat protein